MKLNPNASTTGLGNASRDGAPGAGAGPRPRLGSGSAPAEDVDQGLAEVGIALGSPAEFVVIQIQQMAGQLQA